MIRGATGTAARAGAIRLLAGLGAALMLVGCVPAALMSVASLAGGAAGGGGSAAAGSHLNHVLQAPAAQTARQLDQAVQQALDTAASEPTAICKAALPSEPEAGEGETGCAYRPVCLPGAAAPTRLWLCRTPSAGPAAAPAQVASAGSWTWDAARPTETASAPAAEKGR